MNTPDQKPRDPVDPGKLVLRFLLGMVAAGFVSIGGMLVGAVISAIAGNDSLALWMTLGIAPFAALGARMAWGGVTSDFGVSLALWIVGSIVALVAALLGAVIGHNYINSLPWVVIFASIGANAVPAVAWSRPRKINLSLGPEWHDRTNKPRIVIRFVAGILLSATGSILGAIAVGLILSAFDQRGSDLLFWIFFSPLVTSAAGLGALVAWMGAATSRAAGAVLWLVSSVAFALASTISFWVINLIGDAGFETLSDAVALISFLVVPAAANVAPAAVWIRRGAINSDPVSDAAL